MAYGRFPVKTSIMAKAPHEPTAPEGPRQAVQPLADGIAKRLREAMQGSPYDPDRDPGRPSAADEAGSQAALAREIGMSRSALNRWLTAEKPSAKTIRTLVAFAELATILGVRLEWLIAELGPKKPDDLAVALMSQMLERHKREAQAVGEGGPRRPEETPTPPSAIRAK